MADFFFNSWLLSKWFNDMNIEIYFFSSHQIPFYKRALYLVLEILTPIFLRRKWKTCQSLCSKCPVALILFKPSLGPARWGLPIIPAFGKLKEVTLDYVSSSRPAGAPWDSSLKKLEKEVEAYHSTRLDSLLVLICNKLSCLPICEVSMAPFFFLLYLISLSVDLV